MGQTAVKPSTVGEFLVADMAASTPLSSLGIALPLAEIHDGVAFPGGDDAPVRFGPIDSAPWSA